VSGAIGYLAPDVHRGFDYVTLAKQLWADVPTLRQVFIVGEPGEFTSLAEVDAEVAALPDSDPSNVAFFLLSGGTTALPKLIPRTHDDYAYQLQTAAQLCGLASNDVYLAVLPVEFNFPWGCPGVLGTFHVGGTVVLSEHGDAEHCFELIERENVTFTSVVPTIAQLWTDEAEWTRRDLTSLRFIQVGGAKLAPQLARRIGPALGCRLQQVFGMAEGLLCFTRDSDDENTVATTQGTPMSPADEIRVVDDQDHDVASGSPGHLLARGPYTLRGYFRAPDYNVRAFTDDGFYRTGDVVRLTADRHLIVEGRAKDVIIRGGDKISAAEVEGHLLEHPAVVHAAVVAVPDELLGERTCAYLVASEPPPTPTELRRMLQAKGLADYKLPDRVVFTDGLPLTPLGKVDKKTLTAPLAADL
jgi:2,3-dihydroxybenzoate-AMP ligase